MSQASAKASRREIRKAFGPEALAAVNSHADSIVDILKGMEVFNQRLIEQGESLGSLQAFTAQQVTVQADARAELRDRSLLHRLRWLFFGT